MEKIFTTVYVMLLLRFSVVSLLCRFNYLRQKRNKIIAIKAMFGKGRHLEESACRVSPLFLENTPSGREIFSWGI
jgi:hypothetical protein